MLVHDLATWILNRGVTQDDIDQITESHDTLKQLIHAPWTKSRR